MNDQFSHYFHVETETVRKGLAQIKDWKCWVDYNKDYFFKSCGLSHIEQNVPARRIRYCLVVGCRDRMDSVSNQIRRQMQHEIFGLHVISYDRLADNIMKLGNDF